MSLPNFNQKGGRQLKALGNTGRSSGSGGGSRDCSLEGRGNNTKDLSTPMVPPILVVESKSQGPSAAQCARRYPFSEARRKGTAWNTARLPSGPVFCSRFWTQPCLPYKLQVNCGPSSCAVGHVTKYSFLMNMWHVAIKRYSTWIS